MGNTIREVGFVESAGLLREAFGRIRGSVHAVLDDISVDQLTFRVGDRANSISWLIWHLTRIQDDHVAGVAGTELGYHEAVHHQTVAFIAGLNDADLDRIVDESWDPPVTLGVRLVSVIEDDLQHLGQAAYIRGLSA